MQVVSTVFSFAISLLILHFLVGLTVPVVIGAALGAIVFGVLSK